MTPSTCSVQEKTGGQQEGEHGWVQHVQGVGPVGYPESSSVHRRSP